MIDGKMAFSIVYDPEEDGTTMYYDEDEEAIALMAYALYMSPKFEELVTEAIISAEGLKAQDRADRRSEGLN